MFARSTLCSAVAISVFAGLPIAWAFDIGFTYQGELRMGGEPVNQPADVRFQLFNVPGGGTALATDTLLSLDVSNGLFTAPDVSFGTVADFDGQNLWLEVSVRVPAGGGAYVPLSPRQQIRPTPYALQTRGLFVDDALNVGVGTTTPLDRLHVSGTQRMTDFPVLRMFKDDGFTETLELFGQNAYNGGEVRLYAGIGTLAAYMGCDDSQGGVLQARNNFGDTRVQINGEDNNHAGQIIALSADGGQSLWLRGDAGDGGAWCRLEAADGSDTVVLDGHDANSGGRISVRNDLSEETVALVGDHADDSGLIQVQNRASANNFNGIELDALDEFATGARMLMRCNDGVPTVELDAEDATHGEIALWDCDGNRTFRVFGNTMTIYDDSGSATWSINGNGAKNAIVKTRDHGQRLVYTVESPEVWFEDVGSGQLQQGVARIDLEPVFRQTVAISAEHPLRVFITLTGDCNGVFVEKGTDYFMVRELGGGTSSATFDYRVMAKRAGFETTRLESYLEEPDPASDANLVPANTEPATAVDGVDARDGAGAPVVGD